MAMNSRDTEIGIEWMGESFVATVEYEIHNFGRPGYWYMHPNDPDRCDPEYTVTGVVLRRQTWEGPGKGYQTTGAPFAADGALLDVLANCDEIDQGVYHAVAEEADEHYSHRRRRRYAGWGW